MKKVRELVWGPARAASTVKFEVVLVDDSCSCFRDSVYTSHTCCAHCAGALGRLEVSEAKTRIRVVRVGKPSELLTATRLLYRHLQYGLSMARQWYYWLLLQKAVARLITWHAEFLLRWSARRRVHRHNRWSTNLHKRAVGYILPSNFASISLLHFRRFGRPLSLITSLHVCLLKTLLNFFNIMSEFQMPSYFLVEMVTLNITWLHSTECTDSSYQMFSGDIVTFVFRDVTSVISVVG